MSRKAGREDSHGSRTVTTARTVVGKVQTTKGAMEVMIVGQRLQRIRTM
jgi:hypothetical protein